MRIHSKFILFKMTLVIRVCCWWFISKVREAEKCVRFSLVTVIGINTWDMIAQLKLEISGHLDWNDPVLPSLIEREMVLGIRYVWRMYVKVLSQVCFRYKMDETYHLSISPLHAEAEQTKFSSITIWSRFFIRMFYTRCTQFQSLSTLNYELCYSCSLNICGYQTQSALCADTV